MAEIQSIGSQSLYFAASQAAASSAARQEQAKKTEKTSRTSFASSLKKAKEMSELAEAGLPPEIAGMNEEEAVIYLHDQVNLASDILKANQSLENLEEYRKKVGHFMKYIVKNNFTINVKKRFGRSRRTGKTIPPYVQVQIINERLNKLAMEMLYTQKKNLDLLAKIDEINGMIVDLMAA